MKENSLSNNINESVKRNTIWLFIYNIAKIVFPIVTLPYLTRVLSTDSYGVIAYVKTVMTYMQIFVDFGFILSGTKEIVKALSKKNNNKIGYIVGELMLSRIILGFVGFIILIILSFLLPILKNNILYLFLSYFVVFESIFMMDFLFRGFEKMDIIAKRFVVMKLISTILTFILIKNDADLLLVPFLDIISSTIALITVFYEYKKLKIKLKISNFSNIFNNIKESAVYFLSTAATTSFNAFGTIIIGLYLNNTQVAFWGVCMQIIGTIQALYNPICDGIYPEMLKSKNLVLLKKVFKIFFPIVLLGSLCCYLFAPFGMYILGGNSYLDAVPIFRLLIPCLIFSFPAILLGWPTLGAIEMQHIVTRTTIISLIFNIVFLLLLIPINKFSLINIALVRTITELIMLICRIFYFIKYKDKFKSCI